MSQLKYNDKLYLITRKDLSFGQQAVQSAHALSEFSIKNSEIYKEWFEKSNYLAILAVENQYKLLDLIEKLILNNIIFSIFKEPDLNNQITAIAIEPGEKSKKICRDINLAFK